MILKAERRAKAAGSVAHDADSHLAVRHALPLLRQLGIGRRRFETWYRLLLGQRRRAQPPGGGTHAKRLEERTT